MANLSVNVRLFIALLTKQSFEHQRRLEKWTENSACGTNSKKPTRVVEDCKRLRLFVLTCSVFMYYVERLFWVKLLQRAGGWLLHFLSSALFWNSFVHQRQLKTLRVPPFWMRAGLLIYIMFFKTLARAVDWIFSLRFYRRPLLCIWVNSQWKFVYSIHLIYDMCLLISELRCVFLEVSKWPNSKKISFPLSQISAVLVQLQDYLLLPFVISFERFLWR